ncbi:MAG: hypothetical protein M1832_006173 [Thelocarpon impressellum]|nr:MAG: hypothetical protein M1832_006173 [Thelocarpon impressellum]
MSCYLWKFFLEDDVDRFRRLLAEASYTNVPHGQRVHSGSGGGGGHPVGLSSSIGSTSAVLPGSPRAGSKLRKGSAWSPAGAGSKEAGRWTSLVITRADVNLKDRNGLTILLHAVSSTSKSAIGVALALLEHPLTDLYVQDLENGWTVLHRALYFGNITIARAVMERDTKDSLRLSTVVSGSKLGGLIRIKDREGNSPFDVLNATIAHRAIRPKDRGVGADESDERSDSEESSDQDDADESSPVSPYVDVDGDEVFTFGSNKNLNLGLGNEDDRQFPERIALKRPDHLLHRFYYEHLRKQASGCTSLEPAESPTRDVQVNKPTDQLPSLIRNRPLIVQDVALSKLHTAVCTTDPEANLYMCGFGPGGRLGTGDETTRFSFVCIEGGGLAGKRVVGVGLGQNHSLAITDDGELYSWGSNSFGQLGYVLPRPNLMDDEPVQTLPRQLFGPLKRERIVGAAASRIHSAVFTNSSLFTFGKNEGQLGLVDSDARSLDVQTTPRKVAASLFSSQIQMVSAIDRATICLLENHEVWVFANFGYTKMSFPLEGFSNYFIKNSMLTTRYDNAPNHITKITSGGDTICAMSRMGDVFTVNVGQKLDPGLAATSTTNPTKIRNALSSPQRVWSLRKGHMAVRDVDVGQDGSIIICTDSGSVWRRVKRTKIQDSAAGGSGDYKPKDYKFSRIPGLTRIVAVRSNAFGAYAAVRKDCDVTRTQIPIDSKALWTDVSPLLPFWEIGPLRRDAEDDRPGTSPFSNFPGDRLEFVRNAVLGSTDPEAGLKALLEQRASADALSTDAVVCTSLSSVELPVHNFMLCSRASSLRKLMNVFRRAGRASLPEILVITEEDDGTTRIQFQGFDLLTILNFVRYVYQDSLFDVWHFTRRAPHLAVRYRQVRTELMKVASRLGLRELEHAVRAMRAPYPRLDKDMRNAILDPEFFEDGDAIVELAGAEARVHSAILRRRCPFFEGLFNGHSGGRWLSSRPAPEDEHSKTPRVDLKHVESTTFRYVLCYLYSDAGEELFDDVVSDDLDDFVDLVADTLSVADELMLDRLSQICQKMLGRFGKTRWDSTSLSLIMAVTTRNACQLLNAVAPCSVSAFKDACLEYLCLSLEGLLENQYASKRFSAIFPLTANSLLDDLDDELLLELDDVVRQNQLSCLPFVRSGRAEKILLEKFPEWAEARDRERQIKIDSVTIRARLLETDGRTSGSYKGKHSGTTFSDVSPTLPKYRRRSGKELKDNFRGTPSPRLTSKSSAADLIFDMDDEDGGIQSGGCSPPARKSHAGISGSVKEITARESFWEGSYREEMLSPRQDATSPGREPLSHRTASAKQENTKDESSPRLSQMVQGQAWSGSALSSSKLSMKEIIAQASTSRTSNLSENLSLRGKAAPIASSRPSQRERKKQQQQTSQATPPPKPPPSLPGEHKATSPWQSRSPGPKVSLKEILGGQRENSPSTPIRTSSIPPLSLANTQHPPKSHSHDTHSPTKTPRDRPAYHASPEPALQLSMADIISQQQTEQEVLRQAVAKRSLHEIQQEQAFMEWWDAESRKATNNVEGSQGRPGRGKGGEKRDRNAKGKMRGSGGRGGVPSSRGGGRGGAADAERSSAVENLTGRGRGRGKYKESQQAS